MKKTVLPVLVGEVPSCPSCGGQLAAMFGNGLPDPGDFNVCGRCYAVLRFTDDAFHVRLAAASEIEDASLEPGDADFLLQCFAAHAQQKGVSS